jgi:hypothetical protein
MYNGVTNKYSFEMNGKPITLISLTLEKICKEQLKLKKKNMTKNKSLYINETFFANKVLFGFDDDVILRLCTDLLILEYVFNYTYLRSNILKKYKHDTNQVKFEFGLKMFANKFCEIEHIFQTVHWIKLKIL